MYYDQNCLESIHVSQKCTCTWSHYNQIIPAELISSRQQDKPYMSGFFSLSSGYKKILHGNIMLFLDFKSMFVFL